MIVNTNISSLNAQRNFSTNNTSMSKTLEKLASGSRINRAADDAAGLAISEKMRSQFRGLNQAVKNAQTGISMIQTAEGALNESHSILQRMRELAVQASTDTNTAADRGKIQAEVDQLASELTRITNTTEFNTMNLLGGNFADKEMNFHIGANKDQSMSVGIGAMDAFSLGVAATGTTVKEGAAGDASKVLSNVRASSNELNGATIKAEMNGNNVKLTLTVGSETVTAASTTGGDIDGDGAYSFTLDSGETLKFTVGSKADFEALKGMAGAANSGKEVLKVGAEDSQAATFNANGSIKENAVAGAGLYMGTRTDANAAIQIIDNAINAVSDQRSKLGAYQNRLEHTINNLQVSSENLTASESRIRDADMAAEMSSFVKSQILSQAGVSMLAQANQVPQTVLKLLG